MVVKRAVMVLVLAVVARDLPAQEVVRSCKFEVMSRCASGEVSVSLSGGVPTKVTIDMFWCGRKGTPGFTCLVKYERGDDGSKWTDGGGAVVVENASPWDPARPDQIKITVGKHISLDFEEAQSGGACGAGAELPRAIVIPEGKEQCCAWLNAP